MYVAVAYHLLAHVLQKSKQMKLVPFPNSEPDDDSAMSEVEPLAHHIRFPSNASTASTDSTYSATSSRMFSCSCLFVVFTYLLFSWISSTHVQSGRYRGPRFIAPTPITQRWSFTAYWQFRSSWVSFFILFPCRVVESLFNVLTNLFFVVVGLILVPIVPRSQNFELPVKTVSTDDVLCGVSANPVVPFQWLRTTNSDQYVCKRPSDRCAFAF